MDEILGRIREAVNQHRFQNQEDPGFLYLGRAEDKAYRELELEYCTVFVPGPPGPRTFEGLEVLTVDKDSHLAVS